MQLTFLTNICHQKGNNKQSGIGTGKIKNKKQIGKQPQLRIRLEAKLHYCLDDKPHD